MNCNVVHLSVFILVHFFSVKLVLSSQPSKILVRVFYETQSSSSLNFMTQQMLPVYKKLGNYFAIRFVPFGNAEMNYSKDDDLWYFTCEHGNEECYYNMIHACALSQIKNRDTRAGYIACLMTTKDENSVLEKCSDMFDVNLDDINYCVHKTKNGNHLLAGYGNETIYYFPKGLSVVPTITVNAVYDKKDQNLALNNFQQLICNYINFYYKSPPEECTNWYDN